MKIFLGHATSFDFHAELYEPLKNSVLWQKHEFVLPHLHKYKILPTKEIIQSADLMLAEVSRPSTGLGIELGWANVFHCKIICMHKRDSQPSPTLKMICNHFIVYDSPAELLKELNTALRER